MSTTISDSNELTILQRPNTEVVRYGSTDIRRRASYILVYGGIEPGSGIDTSNPSLLLEGRLGMNISQYFRSSCTIGNDDYQWDDDLEKAVPIGDDNQLEDVDKHWIQYTEDYPTRNKHYKEEDKGDYCNQSRWFLYRGQFGVFTYHGG